MDSEEPRKLKEGFLVKKVRNRYVEKFENLTTGLTPNHAETTWHGNSGNYWNYSSWWRYRKKETIHNPGLDIESPVCDVIFYEGVFFWMIFVHLPVASCYRLIC